MFSRVGPQTFGWLLIDEAGQALPQAAVGALMRCTFSMIVGDPQQIEPVVMLSEPLTAALCREFGVDEDRFSGPTASVQTLADAANTHFSSFDTKDGSREVGVPLLVHRRCSEPMFSIANAIAYDNLMVQAKSPRSSAIAAVLGPAAWHHVVGPCEEKWCEAEGHYVLSMLEALRASLIAPHLYLVTPFTLVQNRLRSLVRESGVLEGWVDQPSRWPAERIGTVHTVKGREAEAVIFVLGAQLATQGGARQWAGQRPNLLNVAVSRAREVLYVVGNRDMWKTAGVFTDLHNRLSEA